MVGADVIDATRSVLILNTFNPVRIFRPKSDA
jgi:hypothetical protein